MTQRVKILISLFIVVLSGCGSGLELAKKAIQQGTGSSSSSGGAASSAFGSAYTFDGVDDRVNISQSSTSTSTYTLEAFVTIPSVVAARNKTIVYFNYGTTSLYLKVTAGDKFEYQLLGAACSGNPWITGTSTIVDGQKYHVAFAHDGSWGRIFVNGTQELQTSSGANAGCNTTTAAIGGDTAANYFPGTIDEVRYSNIARYTANFTPTTVPFTNDANTVLLFHFEETAPTIPNSSPAGTFTLGGAPSVISSPFP